MPADVPTPADFPVTWEVESRWADNDMFGHLNNAVYYALFDSAINGFLARSCGAEPLTDDPFAVVAESGCRFVSELSYPARLAVGLGVERLGTSSVTYRLGLYAASSPSDAPVAAVGRWVHVYVDRAARRSTPLPDRVREVLAGLA